jgi:hypothetical protein
VAPLTLKKSSICVKEKLDWCRKCSLYSVHNKSWNDGSFSLILNLIELCSWFAYLMTLLLVVSFLSTTHELTIWIHLILLTW